MRVSFCLLLCFSVLTSFPANSQPKVVVTFPALYSLAAMVMEGIGQPELLLNSQQDAHHMQLRPSQMQRVLEADLVVYYDADFERFIPRIRQAATKETKFLPLSAVLAEEHQSPQDHGWLNPDFAIAMLDFLSVELGRIDSAHAALYARNAAGYASAIEDKAEGWRAALNTQTPQLWILTDHDAFRAFSRYFGIKNLIVAEDGLGEVNLKNLKQAEGKTISCLLITHNRNALLERLAERLQAKLHTTLNPLGSHIPLSETLYFDLMDELTEIFRECLHQPSVPATSPAFYPPLSK
jgi:zinc transport system substrate-binding protein